jgi:chromosome segregation ATPase
LELEGQIGSIESSLNTALADVEMNKGLAEQLTQEKLALEDQLREAKEVMSSIQSEQQTSESVLASLRNDVSIFYIIH